MMLRSHLFNSGPSSVLRGTGFGPRRGVWELVLTELIDEGFIVTEDRVLSVPEVVSLLALVRELMRLAWASLLVIVLRLQSSLSRRRDSIKN